MTFDDLIPWEIPPALPERQQKFDIFRSMLRRALITRLLIVLKLPMSLLVSFRLRSGPFEGPATVKPPALPEDTYSCMVL